MNRRTLVFLAGIMVTARSFAEEVKPAPVIVEMFESQGCSSCPPAEHLLDQLVAQYKDAIVPLVFHVDYWDGTWKDPFSHPVNTQRQREYTYAFHEDSLYTPEMVVQGEVGFVGSEGRRARAEIEKRLSLQRPRFELIQTPASWAGKADITFKLPSDLNAKTDSITVVVFENKPEVKVQQGENAGVTMSGNYAVQRIDTPPLNKKGEYRVQLGLDPFAVRSKTGVAVLIQGGSHDILAAESIYPLEVSHVP